MSNQQISVPSIDSGEVLDIASVRMRTYYSIHHIRSAAQFARSSKMIEASYSGNFTDELFNEHRAYVTGAVILATSFVEATINELFSNASEGTSEQTKEMRTETLDLLVSVWKLPKIERLSILEKYQLALTLAKRELFDKGASLYQNAHLLIALRNELVHYKPTWVGGDIDLTKLQRQLQALKFSLNPLMPNNPFFPDQCLSHGCAKWAVEASLLFVREFSRQMSITALFDRNPYNLAVE